MGHLFGPGEMAGDFALEPLARGAFPAIRDQREADAGQHGPTRTAQPEMQGHE